MSVRVGIVLTLLPLLAGCDFAPEYHRLDAPLVTAFKEAEGWKPAAPADDRMPTDWWRPFNDTTLDGLEAQLERDSPDLKQALARFEQARATAAAAGSTQYPVLTLGGSAARTQKSRETAVVSHPALANDYALQAVTSWELDFWGRIRNLTQAASERAKASAADFAAARLALETQLAVNYLTLRGLDAQQAMLDRRKADDGDALAFTQRRYQGGAARQIDVDQAQAQLSSTETAATNNRLLRSQLEHAIALLIGVEPANFTLPSAILTAMPPAIDPILPSALLERRPDVAAAERRMSAANTDIGVARAAYFPVFNLAALGGIEAAKPGNLLNEAAPLWAFGASASGALFDGGLRDANLEFARARFEENAALYRQTVLSAYREVEDSLVALHRLAEESESQAVAVDATNRALRQAEMRYKGGVATYLEVITAQNAALTAEATAIDIRTKRLATTVTLIAALGGGWQETETQPTISAIR